MTVARIDDYRATAQSQPLPANLEAESAFLGALLLNNDVFPFVSSFLAPDHFTVEIHRRIYALSAQMIGDGRIASPITLKTFLGEHDVGGGTTIPQYLARLVAEAAPPIVAKDYARAIQELFVRRETIAIANDALAQAFNIPVDMKPQEVATATMERLSALNDGSSDTTRHSAGASSSALVAKAKDIRAGKIVPSGVATGLADLDDATGGYRPGELWIVAGRPGAGKSVVAVASATNVARRGGGVLVFSLEIPEEPFTARMLADIAYTHRRPIPFSSIMRGRLDDLDMESVCDAQERLAQIPIMVDYSSKLTASEIKARIHAEKKRLSASGRALSVVFIDYLKFVQATDRYRGSRVYEIGEISASLKQTAKDEGVCIVLLAQLNRALEARDDKRPGLSDLRDSGDLEADADVVAFIHREAYYAARAARTGSEDAAVRLAQVENQAELILGKNRSGPCKTIELWCDVACSTISSRSQWGDE